MEELEAAALPAEKGDYSPMAKKGHSVGLLVLLMFAFALRVFLLDEQSIWWDEGISLHLGVSSLVDILTDRLNNIHPPFYFILLKGWLSLVGVGAFTGRFLSVLASWLQVVLLLAIAKRWFSRRTGTAALLLATLSAVSVIYGQEIRVYAILTLVYLLLLAATHELTRRVDPRIKRGKRTWIALGLVMWLGLHLHYIVIFVVAYVTMWALIVFVRQRRWVDFRRWLLVLYLVALASLPWFLALWRNWTAVSSEATAGTYAADAAPLSFLLKQVWVFQLTGLAGALARPGVETATGFIAILLLLLVFIRLGQKGTRHDTAALLAHWLIPLSSALIVWTVRSFSHPRYVSMFAPGLLLLVAYVTIPPKDRLGRRLLGIPSILSMILFLAIVFSSLWGLWLHFFDSSVAKDDVRGVARYLEEKAGANDLILVPDTDWSLPFEYEGEAKIAMPRLDDEDQKWNHLNRLTADVECVYLMDYPLGTRDWQELLPFALSKVGTRQAVREFDGLVVYSYVLDEPIDAPEMTQEQIRIGPLRLAGSWIEQDSFAGNGLALALQWELREQMEENAQISLRLLDEGGWPVAEENARLVDAAGRPSQQWSLYETITTYHVLSVPPAVPPFAYDVELQVYTVEDGEIQPLNILDFQNAPVGQKVNIGKSHVAYKQAVQMNSQENLPLRPWAGPIILQPGLMLLAAEPESDSTSPGEPLSVFLLWQSAADNLADNRPEVALVQGGADLVKNSDAPVFGRYPTSVWSNGEQVFERRVLLIPPDAKGMVEVVLRLDGKEYQLGELEIEEQSHSFTRPDTAYTLDATFGDLARLTGFNLRKTTFTSDETVPLTLAWQSLAHAPQTEYVVFTHLLDDQGRIIAQHDGPPARGDRKTTSWLAQEYILDEHEMTFLIRGYEGEGVIEVGWYDPVSGERLQSGDGADHVILPVQITIE